MNAQPADNPGRIEINESVAIDENELTFTFQRSGGPGGQNVNKVATRATLHFNIRLSSSLTGGQKIRIFERLGKRISDEGMLRIICSTHRTQAANRKAAVRRFQKILAGALHRQPTRKPTSIPASVKRRRLAEKRQRGGVKRLRGSPSDED